MITSRRSIRTLVGILLFFVAFSLVPVPEASAANYNYQVLSGRHDVSGAQRALIVLVDFQDVPHTKNASDIRAVAVDQLNQYYAIVSRGKVSITGDVYGWYRANHPMSYYGHDDKNPGDDNNVLALAKDALSLLPTDADLSPFNFLVVVHAGKDQAGDENGVASDEIWSSCFCSTFPDYEPYSPVSGRSKTFESYTFLSEFNGVGTFAHEWGHFFGLPDLYDVATGDSYVGYWSLMDAGNWCCPNEDQTTPADIGAWGDALLGWLKLTVAETNLVLSPFSLNPLESANPTAILIPVSPSTYYFVEYRMATGIDSSLPASGILVYFVNERLETGHGILRLENPKTGKLYLAQKATRNLNGATFKNGDKFRDSSNHVNLAFLGGKDSFTALYSTQELTGEVLKTSLTPQSIPSTATYGDAISVSGTLLDESGNPLVGQPVELDTVDPTSSQWNAIGSTVTGQQGEVSLQAKLSFNVGNQRFRLFYPGGKIGNTWYSSSITEFSLRIDPAAMKIEFSLPKIVGPEPVSVKVLVTKGNGDPLPGATVEIYVDNIRTGTVETDSNGTAILQLPFGLADLGSHTITFKATADNYSALDSRDSILITPPFWLIATVIAVLAAVVAVRIIRRRKSN